MGLGFRRKGHIAASDLLRDSLGCVADNSLSHCSRKCLDCQNRGTLPRRNTLRCIPKHSGYWLSGNHSEHPLTWARTTVLGKRSRDKYRRALSQALPDRRGGPQVLGFCCRNSEYRGSTGILTNKDGRTWPAVSITLSRPDCLANLWKVNPSRRPSSSECLDIMRERPAAMAEHVSNGRVRPFKSKHLKALLTPAKGLQP